jgi:hypothetical protein
LQVLDAKLDAATDHMERYADGVCVALGPSLHSPSLYGKS